MVTMAGTIRATPLRGNARDFRKPGRPVFTIAGARKQLELGLDDSPPPPTTVDVLAEVKSELREILNLIDMSGRGAAR